ncbi:hypothetical protein [Candidatus Mycoplasma haematobovis]|nr:hypothetical protein [Candidatus Mycoplasma haematobovis]
MAIKQIAILGTTTTVVGGSLATGSYLLLRDNSIRKQILNENKKILDIAETNNTLWEIKLSAYTREEKRNNDLSLTTDDIKNLKEWCTKTLANTFNNKDDKSFKSAQVLCTVPTNKEKLLKDNKTIATSAHWANKLSAYKQPNEQTLIPAISKDTAKAKDIEDWCAFAINDEYTKDTENNYSLTLKWCTVQGS